MRGRINQFGPDFLVNISAAAGMQIELRVLEPVRVVKIIFERRV